MLRTLLAPLALALAPLAARAQTDVVVVILDDVSWEDLAAVPTPVLDGIGLLGRRYDAAYASPTCSPSRYQLLFGRLPHREFVGSALVASGTDPADLGAATASVSVAEALGTAGYRTGLFGKWHVNNRLAGNLAELGRVHGFQAWRAGIPGNLVPPYDHYSWRRHDDGQATLETTYTTEAIEAAFRGWWTTTPGPRLAYVSFAAAHEPFQAPPAWMLPPGHVVGADDRARFEASVMGLDHAVGLMASYVDLTSTLVLVVADNGTPAEVPPPGGTSPGYKLSTYEGGIRVPLLAVGAGVVPGSEPSLVQLVDLPGTLLDVAGVTPPTGFEDARSFAATLSGSAPSARPWAFVQRFAPNGGLATTLTRDDWALVWPDGWKVLVQDGGAPEAYDLTVDPGEASDLAGTALGAARVARAWALRATILGPGWPY